MWLWLLIFPAALPPGSFLLGTNQPWCTYCRYHLLHLAPALSSHHLFIQHIHIHDKYSSFQLFVILLFHYLSVFLVILSQHPSHPQTWGRSTTTTLNTHCNRSGQLPSQRAHVSAIRPVTEVPVQCQKTTSPRTQQAPSIKHLFYHCHYQ